MDGENRSGRTLNEASEVGKAKQGKARRKGNLGARNSDNIGICFICIFSSKIAETT